MSYLVVGLALVAIAFVLTRLLSATDIAKIRGLPEIPGVPVLGNLWQLGTDHARVAQRWAQEYEPVFQTRLGNRGFTIGTSPWDESCKRRRKTAAAVLNRSATKTYAPMIDVESTASIRELLQDSKSGLGDVNPTPYFQRFALNMSLALNYGFRITGSIDDELLREITHVERNISNLRSTSNNWQDYVPLLRFWGAQDPAANEFRTRRDKYLDEMLELLKARIADGSDKPFISGSILKDPEAKLSHQNVVELKSICLSMISGGLDNIPATLSLGLAFLSTPQGRAVQSKAREAIEEAYPSGEAWHQCLAEDKVPYVTAFVKETLHYWSILPIGLPRRSIKDIPYQDAVIPAGTTFYMNTYAAHYDESHFKMPHQFLPERHFEHHEAGTSHYAFGAGSRMCIGSHLATRELYVCFVRLITAFDILPATDPADAPEMDAIECNAMPKSLSVSPKSFKISLRPRNESLLRKCIAASEERTQNWYDQAGG